MPDTAIIIGANPDQGYGRWHVKCITKHPGIDNVIVSRRDLGVAAATSEEFHRQYGGHASFGFTDITNEDDLKRDLDKHQPKLVSIAVRDPIRGFVPQRELTSTVLEHSNAKVFCEKPIDDPRKEDDLGYLEGLASKFGDSNRFGYNLPSVLFAREMCKDPRLANYLDNAASVSFYWSSIEDTDKIIADLGLHITPFFMGYTIKDPVVDNYGNRAEIQFTLQSPDGEREIRASAPLERDNNFRGIAVCPQNREEGSYIIALDVDGVNNTLYTPHKSLFGRKDLREEDIRKNPIGQTVVNPLAIGINALLDGKPAVGLREALEHQRLLCGLVGMDGVSTPHERHDYSAS